MMRKRGQEGGTLTTLIVIIILAVLAVLLILFLTGFFGDVGEAQNILTEQTLTLLSQSCGLKADQGDKPGYCDTFIEVTFSSGLESYVNCQYPQVEGALDNTIASATCGSLTENSKEFCAELEVVESDSFDAEKVNVNGQKCSDHLASTAPSAIADDEENTCADLAGERQTGVWVADLDDGDDALSAFSRCSSEFEGTVRTAGVTDQDDKDANEGKVCCVHTT